MPAQYNYLLCPELCWPISLVLSSDINELVTVKASNKLNIPPKLSVRSRNG